MHALRLATFFTFIFFISKNLLILSLAAFYGGEKEIRCLDGHAQAGLKIFFIFFELEI